MGLTTDEMSVRTRKRKVDPFDVRRSRLENVLDPLSRKYGVPYSISGISDRFGFATRKEIDSIVVSEETEHTVDEIDEERRRSGLPPLERFVVPMVDAVDGERISSTRIVHGEIDPGGGMVKARSEISLCIHSGSKNPFKAEGLLRAFRRHASNIQLFRYDVSPVTEAEGSEGIIEGARSRCAQVMDKNLNGRITDTDYFVGIESGMVEMKGSWFLFHCCIVWNEGVEGIGLSSGIEVPSYILQRIMVYKGKRWDVRDISGNRTSIIEKLSAGSMSRVSLVEESCRMALLSLSNHKECGSDDL